MSKEIKENETLHCTSIGGQAVIEGVMMRGPKRIATAVRKPDGEIIVDEKELGKPVGSDGESDKSTYVSLLGLEKSREYADELTNQAVDALDVFGEDADFLKEIAQMLVKRTN